MKANVRTDYEKTAGFCQRWKITELSFFGSVLRDNFRPDSDVDILVTFAPDANWSLFDHVHMEEELSNMLGRKVDLVTRRAIERGRVRGDQERDRGPGPPCLERGGRSLRELLRRWTA